MFPQDDGARAGPDFLRVFSPLAHFFSMARDFTARHELPYAASFAASRARNCRPVPEKPA
jgi:hypothetical protein